MKALTEVFTNNPKYDAQRISTAQLRLGMILGEDIRTKSDVVLASKGQEVNESITLRIQNSARMIGVKEEVLSISV
ncbi:MAG: hypothetical protein MRJ68_12975 [Nitrospira sp.]|nr:hypothetical protein [Nitrospira sp.]